MIILPNVIGAKLTLFIILHTHTHTNKLMIFHFNRTSLYTANNTIFFNNRHFKSDYVHFMSKTDEICTQIPKKKCNMVKNSPRFLVYSTYVRHTQNLKCPENVPTCYSFWRHGRGST